MTVPIQFITLLRERGPMTRIQLEAATGRTTCATRSVLTVLCRTGYVVNVASRQWPAIYDLSELGRSPEAMTAWRDLRSSRRPRRRINKSIVAQALRGSPNSVWALGDRA